MTSPKPDTSVEAVERLAEALDGAEQIANRLDYTDWSQSIAATLRQLRKELTEAQEKLAKYDAAEKEQAAFYDWLTNLCENPPEPTEALKEALAKCQPWFAAQKEQG